MVENPTETFKRTMTAGSKISLFKRKNLTPKEEAKLV